jgi:hypothetical protein
MASAVPLRSDFDGAALRRLARASKAAGQTRRLLALAAIYDGGLRRDNQVETLASIRMRMPLARNVGRA